MILFDWILGISVLVLGFAYRYYLHPDTLEIVINMGLLLLAMILAGLIFDFIASFFFKFLKGITQKYILK